MSKLTIQGLLAITATLWLSQPTFGRTESDDLVSNRVDTMEHNGDAPATGVRPWEEEEQRS